MLTLLTFPPSADDLSPSPFCNKAMLLLQMSGLPWQRADLPAPFRMPYGRLPVLKTDDRLIPDSSQIQAYLETRGADFFAGLTAREIAHARALIRMIEDSLRYGLVHDRWLDPDCWPHIRQELFGAMPLPMRLVVPGLVRRKLRRTLRLQGTGQFSPADRLERLRSDLSALRETLGDRAFLFGDRPTAADATAVPMLRMLRDLPAETALRRAVRQHSALMAYVERGTRAMYPGYVSDGLNAAA
ncbi:MAG: glutathione S-transferase family protein [Roseivivax sp.]|nr:glutathione S-transferase family protein [Roseivivax sp.]